MAGEALNANYLIVVGLFLAIMLLAVVAAKMFKTRLTPGMQTGRQLALKEHLMLGSHEKVCLIEVDGKPFMVGMVRQQPMCIVPVEGALDTGAEMSSPAPVAATADKSAHVHKARFDQVLGASAADDDDEDALLLVHQARGPAKPPQKNILKNAGVSAENRQEPQPPKPAKTNKKGEHSAILSAMRQARRANPKLGF